MNHSQWISLGKVGKARGLKGEFFMTLRDEPFPKEISSVRIGLTETGPVFTVAFSKWHKNLAVLSCREILSREAAEELRGHTVWAKREEIKVDYTKEYSWNELIGRVVIDTSRI